MNKINFYLFDYVSSSILRHKSKNIFIIIIFTLLVALLSSIFFITNSIQYELNLRLKNTPDIVIENYKAGLKSTIKESTLDKILEVNGITSGRTRIEGDYDFGADKIKFHLIGIDSFEKQDDDFLQKLANKYDLNTSSMLVSLNVKRVMKKSYYEKYFNFIEPNSTLKKVFIRDSFDVGNRMEFKNTIILDKKALREIFGFLPDEASDIALDVANKNELDFITSKIRLMLPNTKVISKDDLKLTYEKLFNYDSGVFLSIFIISIFTFFIIMYDKSNGLSSEEKREIGILKAIGWRVEDILHAKFYEAFIISFFSFMIGIGLAFIYVFILKAPILGNIFSNESLLNINNFHLLVHMKFTYILLIFLLTVPIYIAATLIPSWRVATLDADEVMR
jgi:ABC-type lipoprotein release transport system permease subunit